MKLKNSLPFFFSPIIPESLRNRIVIQSTTFLEENEINACNASLRALEQAICKDNSIPPEAHINMIFTDDNAISLIFDSPDVLGYHIPLAIYPLKHWREKPYTHLQMCTMVVEELAHNFWSIQDEIFVKHKVHQILKHEFPEVTFNDLYPGISDLN